MGVVMLWLVTAERTIVNYTQMVFPWLTHNPLSAAAILFGGATVVVLLYTYVYDYRMLTHRVEALAGQTSR